MKPATAEPKWLTKRMVLAIHDEAVAMFGGTAGIRDEGLLESALNRPRNRHAYENEATMFDLAASLCHGICKNHPFLDGNKRTALLSGRAFLFLNGYAFEPREVDEVENMVAVASGAMEEAELAAWFREFSAPVKAPRK
jgi:death-on-curing protein